MTPSKSSLEGLSRRERQIMDVLFRRRRATAAEVRADLPQPPSYSAVRALLRILEEKGCIEHDEDGARYVYRPKIPVRTAKRAAARRLLETFFAGSVAQAVATLLDVSASELSDKELLDLQRRIDQARKEGR